MFVAHPLLYMRGTGHKIDINIMGGSHGNFSRTRLDYGVRPTVFYGSLPWEEAIENDRFWFGKIVSIFACKLPSHGWCTCLWTSWLLSVTLGAAATHILLLLLPVRSCCHHCHWQVISLNPRCTILDTCSPDAGDNEQVNALPPEVPMGSSCGLCMIGRCPSRVWPGFLDH